MRFKNQREKRHFRVRKTVSGTQSKPRLAVFRSNKNIFAQIIDDDKRITLVSMSSMSLKDTTGTKSDIALLVGKKLGELAIKANVKEVVFDRAGYKYHGRIKNLALGARDAGLKF